MSIILLLFRLFTFYWSKIRGGEALMKFLNSPTNPRAAHYSWCYLKTILSLCMPLPQLFKQRSRIFWLDFPRSIMKELCSDQTIFVSFGGHRNSCWSQSAMPHLESEIGERGYVISLCRWPCCTIRIYCVYISTQLWGAFTLYGAWKLRR